MLEAFVYPVSAVMKLWHWLLADVFSVPHNTAWVASIFLLVITVRGFLLPFNWAIFKSSRVILLMRPEQQRLEQRYGHSLDPEEIKAHDAALEHLNKQYGYNPLAGCVPPLVQIPFIIGLYRLLIWMSVPENGRAGTNIGVLSAADIASFLDASFLGVPLPAYVAMSPEQFGALNTHRDAVLAAAVPLLLFAVVFTTVNMVVSQLRARVHMDWNQALARGVYNIMWVFLLLTPVMLGSIALTGLIPIALLMYWFINNLWTLGQTIVLWWTIAERYPLTEDHRQHIRRTRTLASTDKRLARKDRYRRLITALTHPSTHGHLLSDINAEKAAEKRARKEDKAARKMLKKQQSKIRSHIRKEEIQQLRRSRSAGKDQRLLDDAPDTPADTARGPARDYPVADHPEYNRHHRPHDEA